MKAAKIIWNNNNWERPGGYAVNGIHVNAINPYNYALEEFLFSEQLKNHKIGYLDCYRRVGYNYTEPVNLALFTLNHEKNVIHVANLYGVTQLQDDERLSVWNEMNREHYLENVVIPAFNTIEEIELPKQALGATTFVNNNFGSESNNLPFVQAAAPLGFFVNIKYEKLVILNKNLTAIDTSINIIWKKLSVRYRVDKLKNRLLREYLENSL